ncbi:hypothetical protein JXB11_01485 [Candidatus Woesearchaeota archaeon]|nr:hypothetical protein [Candidatus Woesearchaeota archaeon]
MRRCKRGVSPLIATVLLIAFAVALGAVVMNWGKSYAQETADTVRTKSDKDVKCSIDVSIEVAKISSTPQICYGGGGASGYIFFIVNNAGTKEIEEIELTVIGENDVYSNSSLTNSSIAIAGSLRKNVSYSYNDYGPVKQIRLIPKIDVGGTTVACAGNALEKDDTEITNCTSI